MTELLWALHVGLFGAAAAGCFWGVARSRSDDDRGVRRSLMAFFGLSGLWGVANALVVASRRLVTMEVFYTAGLVLGLLTVVAWLWFCSAYTGYTYHTDRHIQAGIAAVTLLVVGTKVTNPIHGAYYTPAVASKPFVHFAPELGVVHWLTTGLTYVAAAVGLYMLFEAYFRSNADTTKVVFLSVVLAVPILPKLLAVAYPDSLLLVFYEPVGTAVFAVGVSSFARESFLSARIPARRQLIDRIDELVVVTDDEGRIADFSDDAVLLFPELPSRVGDRIDEVLPAVAGAGGDVVELDAGSDTRYFTVHTPELTRDAFTVGRAYVLSDVTELEQHRRRLSQQARHVDNIADAMAHELRNPLTIIVGHIEALLDDAARAPGDVPTDGGVAPTDDPARSRGQGRTGSVDVPDAEARLLSVLRASERMEGVVDDLVSIVEHGKPLTGTERFAVSALFEAAHESFGDLGLELSPAVEPTTVVANRARCVQLCHYLLRAHGERGATAVRVEVDADAGAVVVTSDGRPFETDSPENLFRYGQEAGEDVRMLLANAWTLANLHGWDIEADLEASEPCLVLTGLELLSG